MSPPPGLGGPPGADGHTEFVPDDLTRALSQLTGWAIEKGISLDELDIIRPSLEDVYLELTGPEAAPAQPAQRQERRLAR